MEEIRIDIRDLKKQIKALLESNMPEEQKTGLHNLLGALLDNALEERKRK